ncbi:hypothetical protein D3C71_1332260 [compost metagenome]
MKLKFYKLHSQFKSSLINFLYWLMKPLAYFYTKEKIDARYYRKEKKISKQKAVKYIAEDIAKHIATRKNAYTISFIVADIMNGNDFIGYESLSYISSYLLKRKKTRIGYFKLDKSIEVQEAIIDVLKSHKGIKVVEEIEVFTCKEIINYQKTYHVSYEG